MGSSMKYRVTQVALVRQVGRNGLSLVTTLDQSSRSDSKGMNGRNQPNRDPTTPVSLAMAFAKAFHHSWNSCPLDIHSSSSWIWFKLIRSMILCSFRGLWLEDYSVCSILFCLRMVYSNKYAKHDYCSMFDMLYKDFNSLSEDTLSAWIHEDTK